MTTRSGRSSVEEPLCYFAHHITDYGTEREKDAVDAIVWHGFEVVNPNSPEHDRGYKEKGMEYFLGVVATCDALAFQRFEDGQIGAGVGSEIMTAVELEMPVYEIKDDDLELVDGEEAAYDALSVDETRALLRRIRVEQSS